MSDEIDILENFHMPITFKGNRIHVSFEEDSTPSIQSLVMQDPQNPDKKWLLFGSRQNDYTIVVYNEDGDRIIYMPEINGYIATDEYCKLDEPELKDLGNGFLKLDRYIIDLNELQTNKNLVMIYPPRYSYEYARFEFPGDGTARLMPLGTSYPLAEYCKLSFIQQEKMLEQEDIRYKYSKLESPESLLHQILNASPDIPIQYSRCPPMTEEEVADMQRLENHINRCNCCKGTIKAFEYPEHNANTDENIQYFKGLSYSAGDFKIETYSLMHGNSYTSPPSTLINTYKEKPMNYYGIYSFLKNTSGEFYVLKKDDKRLCIKIDPNYNIWVWGHEATEPKAA